MKRVAEDDANKEKVEGFVDGPALGPDFADIVTSEIDKCLAGKGDPHFFLHLYDTPFAIGSALEFGRWYEEMAYLANHRPTLRESKQFKRKLDIQTRAIVDAFIRGFSHPTTLVHAFFDNPNHVLLAWIAKNSSLGKFITPITFPAGAAPIAPVTK